MKLDEYDNPVEEVTAKALLHPRQFAELTEAAERRGLSLTEYLTYCLYEGMAAVAREIEEQAEAEMKAAGERTGKE